MNTNKRLYQLQGTEILTIATSKEKAKVKFQAAGVSGSIVWVRNLKNINLWAKPQNGLSKGRKNKVGIKPQDRSSQEVEGALSLLHFPV